MSCAELQRTQAFIDGEIAGEAAAAAERHIAACPDCQAFCADAAGLSDAIRTSASRHSAPAGLRRRLRAGLDAEDERRRARRFNVQTPSRGSFWRGALSGAGLTAAAASLAILALQPPAAASLAEQVTDAHTAALMNGRMIEVASSDHHTVKPWFAGRIAISPPVHDFADQGFTLAGGRLDKVGRTPAAALVYAHGRHKVDLFVWADRGAPLPAPTVRHGYRAMFWRAGDLDFAAVSDTGAPELAKFVQLVQSQRE